MVLLLLKIVALQRGQGDLTVWSIPVLLVVLLLLVLTILALQRGQ